MAEILLGQLNYDGYFLEYDTDRAGGFEPLRFLSRGSKKVVVGLITSKSGTLGEEGRHQDAASMRRRNSRRSSNSACRRNAALPPPRKATS